MAGFAAGAKHLASLAAGSMEGAYGVAMVKATNLDIVAPKEKHVRFLIQWTNENCSDDDLTAVFRCLAARLEEKVITVRQGSPRDGARCLIGCHAKAKVHVVNVIHP